MARFIVKRLLLTLFVLVCVSIIAFLLVRIAPGSPAKLLLPDSATPEQVAAMEVKLGLDRPLIEQYFKYIIGVFHGDFGMSTSYRTPVLPIILARLPVTAKIAFGTVLFGAIISIVLGVVAGANRGKPIDFVAVAFALFGQSIATPWLAILLVYIFALKLNILPAIGAGQDIKYYILPIATNVMMMAAGITRLARSGMIDTLNEDYITATYAKGIRRSIVNWRYAFKNAMIPVVTMIGLNLGLFLAGAVVVETVFSMSGIGFLLYESVNQRDYALMQSIVLICAFFIAIINLI
ncbi:MAG: ABC transporter permease, partial [Mycoplasmataceae bacterium]|nr:ABC transporter permease [Mycoplasmataceae bacterium]